MTTGAHQQVVQHMQRIQDNNMKRWLKWVDDVCVLAGIQTLDDNQRGYSLENAGAAFCDNVSPESFVARTA